MEASKIRLTVPEGIDPSCVLGAGDGVLRVLESLVRAHVVARGDSIAVSGDPDEVELVARFFEHAFREAAAGRTLSADDVSRCLAVLRDGEHEATSLRDDVLLSYRGRVIRPKTLGQKRYVDAIRSHTITFGLGPAGTGKTYLAMALAVAALKRHEVGRLILTRPVVEAGENLGFLPGTLEEKIDPYMRPLYDALFDMMDRERTDELMERGVIEIAPLAYMRGRTLSDAFVVLDEAQNTTPEQMKMFLTRL
ncbi:MAG: PhoH family protein, partial [Collinsella sp.]|nr:PhoH family protein [Collinsella sp.]